MVHNVNKNIFDFKQVIKIQSMSGKLGNKPIYYKNTAQQTHKQTNKEKKSTTERTIIKSDKLTNKQTNKDKLNKQNRRQT